MTQSTKTSTGAQIKQAFQLVSNGKLNEAHAIFTGFSSDELSDPDTLMQLGTLALHLDENLAATSIFSRVTTDDPQNATALCNLGMAWYRVGKPSLATNILEKALDIKPDMVEAHVLVGKLLNESGDYANALSSLERAVTLKPSNELAQQEMIIALRALNRHDEAYEVAKKLIRTNNSSANCAIMSRVLIELGRLDEATRFLEKAIELDKACGVAYHDLASIRKFSRADKKQIHRFEKALQQGLPANQRSLIHFALGKIYNDCEQYDSAFEHYRLANTLVKDAVAPDYVVNNIKKIKKVFSSKLLKHAREHSLGSDSHIPVFVVGMPRSGTTLIEQIIASHPQAAGAGELVDMQYISERLVADDASYSGMVRHLTKDFVMQQAQAYLQSLRAGREQASRIVDKMPLNYAYIGAIHLLFPEARIVHAVRHPLDTCLSCYFQPMPSVPASYDLEWLAAEYALYRKTIEYWKQLLPAGSIIDVCYEDLVNDTESGIRQLIDDVGLPWDAACLAFHESKRAIGTASLWQARQPIYTHSRRRWLNYAGHLAPLATGLRDYLDADDISLLAEHGVKVKKPWWRKS